MDGDDVFGIGGPIFKFLPELCDVIIDRSSKRKVVISPDGVEQLITGDGLAAMLDEILQDVEFARRELRRASGFRDLMAREGNVDIAKRIFRDVGDISRGSTQMRSNASEQFFDAE